MHHALRLPRHLFVALLCLALGPAVAQDGGCGDEGIDVSDDPAPGEEAPAKGGDGYDPEETRRKNAGLAGGGPEDEGDPDAPKVKADLQTRINEAIAKGVEWLKKRQGKDGSWGPVRADTFYNDSSKKGDFVRDELGPTAWSIYTLAKCGVKRNDVVMKDGLKWIEKNTEFVFDVIGGDAAKKDETKGFQAVSRKNPRPLSTYEGAAIVMMIEAVYQESAKLTGQHSKRRLYSDNPMQPPDRSKIPEDVWKKMHERLRHLTIGRHAAGKGVTITGQQNLPENGQGASKHAGGWRYGQAMDDADLSATQFVLLALRAASQAGYPIEKVSPKTWEAVAQYVKNSQKADGGFPYQIGGQPTGSMTACGVGCLLICKEQMALSETRKPPAWIDGAIANGMGWLDKNFDAEHNIGETGHHFYYLYGIERVGDLSGRREFNGKDWYLRGATLLVERQDADGKWQDGSSFRPHDVLGTCFALLFLKRATIPVVTISEPAGKPGE